MANKFLFTDNKDKSGELKVYEGNNFSVLIWDIPWTPSGSGQYTQWNDTHTDIIAIGSQS